MSKISIYLEDNLEAELDELIKKHPDLTKRNRSELFNLLLTREIRSLKRTQMIDAAAALDELEIGWNEEEEYCAIADMEVSG